MQYMDLKNMLTSLSSKQTRSKSNNCASVCLHIFCSKNWNLRIEVG